jgi:hypothetical protein
MPNPALLALASTVLAVLVVAACAGVAASDGTETCDATIKAAIGNVGAASKR